MNQAELTMLITRFSLYTHDRDVAAFCEGQFDSPSSIPLPNHPSVYISKRCADSVEGRGLTAALVAASVKEWGAIR